MNMATTEDGPSTCSPRDTSTKEYQHTKLSMSLDRYNLLVEFAHRHVDFHSAELESVLKMNGMARGQDFDVVPLPSEDDHDIQHRRPFVIISFPMESEGVQFSFDIKDVRDDIDKDTASTCEASRAAMRRTPPPTVAEILSRCALVKSVAELWGAGSTIDECAESVRALTAHPVGRRTVRRCLSSERSWKMTVHTLGSTYSREEQGAMRAKFAFLDFPGEVKMKGFSDEYIMIREIELDARGSPRYPRHGLKKELRPDNDSRPPLAVYFGRILGGSRNWREGIDRYSLKKRSYLGPTSMDSELSLIMTNLGMVKKGSFCFDPFAGTGSILLTCALRGAYCFGTDIDIRVLRGRGADENVLSNFREFNLVRPDLVRSDNAIYHRHYRSHRPLFDAIVCDPPYGIRAGARKSGSKLDRPRPVAEEHRGDHIAQTKPYPVSDVMADLLDVAARTLVIGGRLVYIIPSMTDFDAAEDLPRHDCLRLVHICYQPLQLELGRRMVTMEKIAEYDQSRRKAYLLNSWKNGAESAEKCANIRDKLFEAAKKKPGYEEKAAFRRQKRKATKQAKKLAKRETASSSPEN